MKNEKYIALAKKLYELSKRGIDAEKQNAQNMLYALMKKHNISMSDLEAEKKEKRCFKYSLDHEASIIKAVMFKVLNVANLHFYCPPKGSRKKYLVFELTDYQYMEAVGMIGFYKNDFNSELKLFTRAYIAMQRINSDIEPEEDEDIVPPPCSNKEREEDFRIAQMAQGIKRKSYLKQLE